MKLDTALLYRSWYDFANTLDDERKAIFYTKIMAYLLDETEPDWGDDELLQGFWLGAKPNADKCIKNRKNGAKGGRPPKKDKTVKTPLLTPLKTYIDKAKIRKCPSCGDVLCSKDNGEYLCFSCYWEGKINEITA